MKTFQFTFLLLFIAVFSNAQTWHYDYSFTNQLFPFGATSTTSQDNYLFLTSREIIEMSEYGEPVFFYDFTGSNFYNRTFVEKQSDGYLLGYMNGNPSSGDLSVGKLGLNGTWLWQTNLSRPFQSIFGATPACALTDNNEVFVAGVDSCYLINTNTGNIIWRTFLSNDAFISATKSTNEFVAIAESGHLTRIDNNGNILSNTTLNISPKSIISTSTHFVITGSNTTNIATLITINKATNNQNTYTFGVGTIYDVKETYDGYILSGDDGNNAFLIKTDALGNQQWQKFYGNGAAKNVETSRYNGFVAMIFENDQIRMLKTDENGNTKNSSEKLVRYARSIDVSNIKTQFTGDGVMFWDYQNAYFRFPKDSATSSIFAGGLWMGGLDGPGGNLKIAAETYRSDSNRDYWAGYNGDGGRDHNLVNKVWKIKRKELRDFLNDYADGSIDRPIPNDILTWPAIGNPHFKGIIDSVFTINQPLADFVDANNDGIYNAYDGDYPVMKGDEMLWWVFNDNKGIHTATTGDPIRADIIARAYGYDCAGNEDIYNTLFLEYDIINTSSIPLNDFYVGLWTDFDLGCFTDDFVGTDTISNTFYVYNDGNVDGAGGCGSIPTYGNNTPIQSVSLLNQQLSSFSYHLNGGWPGLPETGSPSVAPQFFNILTGKWRDGTPYYTGGNGYTNANSPVTNYTFPGNPSDNSSWSLCSTSLPGADMRTVGSTGPFTIQPGGIISVKYAYTMHENVPLPCPDISTDVRSNVNNVKNIWNNNNLDWIPNLGNDRTINSNSTITLNPEYNGASYLWSDNSTSSTLDITTPGVYSVTITDVNGCQKTDEVNIYGYTNNSQIENNLTIDIFPNPTDKQLNINLNADFDRNFTISLSNALGQLISEEQINGTHINHSINTEDFSNGLYLITVKENQKVIKTEKIIIQH